MSAATTPDHHLEDAPTMPVIPIAYIRYSLKEVKDRVKNLELMCSFMEDQCDIENRFGLVLQKTTVNPVGARADWLPVITAAWGEVVKSSVGIGKLHVTHSVTVASNVTKVFPECLRSISKKLATIATQVQHQLEEISKAKKGYVKCMDKYRKACADAEAALKARDSAISNLSLGGSLGNAVTADHVTKMTTKCRDALKEYDSCETVVVAAINKFNVLRERYTNDINYIHTSELASMEDARTLPLQEYFEKCAIASNLIVNKSCEVVKSSLESLVGLDTNSELTPLHAALKCLDDFTASVDLDPVEVTGGGVLGAPDGEEGGVGSTNILEESCMEEEESETSAQKLLNNEVHSVGMQINTNMEYLDLFKTVSVRILQLLSDIRNDIEKTYVRASYKLMEKHGYSDMVSPVSLPYCTINNSSVLLPVTDVSAVSDKESNALCASQTVPTARVSAPDSSSFGNCWNSIVSYNVAMLDAYANFVHLLNTTVLPKHEAIVRKVDASKKDAFEKQSFHMKRIEAARNTSKKAWMKLTKIRRELKERRAAVKSSQAAENSNDKVLDTGRDSLTSLSAPPVSDVTLSPEQKLCASRVQELEEETEENVNDISTDSVSNVTSQLAPTAKVGRRGSVFDKFVRGTQKLGAVVGLATAETHAARIQRIQLQITDMEHEEVLCKAQWDSANEQLNEACTSYISTLTDCLEKLNNDMQADIDYFKSSSQSIFDTYTCIYKETVGSLSQQIKASADAIDREKDYASMVSCINGRGDNAYSAASDPSMDTTSDDCSIMNDIIHQEKHLGESGSKMLRTMGISAQQTVGGVLSSASSRGNKWTLMEEIELLEPIAAFQRVTCDLIEREKCSQKATIVDVSGNVSKLNLHSEIGNHAISKPGDVGATKDIPVSAEAGATNANDFGGDVDSENHSTEPRPARRRSRRRSHSFDAKQMQTMLNSSPIGSDADGRLISNDSAKVDSGVSDSRNRPRLFSGDKGGAEVPKSTGVSVGSSASVSNGGGTNSGGIMKELVKFGLSASDRIIESHACAYYPKRGLLSQGRMYITQHFAAFSSWDGTRILIPLYYVQSIEKMNSLFILSNALLIKTYSFDVQRTTSSAVGNAEAGESDEAELEQSLVNVNGEEEYSFGSFIDRDQCFTLLTRLQEIEKRLFSINQEEMKELLLRGNLVFGNQSAKDKENQDNGDHPESGDTSLSNVNCGDGAEGDASAVELAPKPQQRRQSTAAALALKFTKKLANATKKKETVPQPLATVVPFAAEKISDAEFPASEAEQEVGVDMTNYVDDGKVFSTLWKSANIGSLVEDVLPGSVQKVFRTLWLKTAGYGDFLASQGDFDINISEWAPYTSEGGLVVEDVSKTSFSFMRKGDFLHPRTSMLMFGPKNALNTQSHYLYIVNNKGETKPPEGDGDWLASTIPVKFMVVTVSTFDSIPMADVFKLAQYWSFEAKQLPDGSPDPINTIIRGGLNVYFVKYTLIKGQISQGCTEELVDMSKAWVTHAKKRLTASKSTSIPTIADGGAVVGVSESPMAGYTASVQPYFNEHYSQVIIGCLILLILLLICLLIQQYRSHYFIIRHVDSLLDAYQKSAAECVAK